MNLVSSIHSFILTLFFLVVVVVNSDAQDSSNVNKNNVSLLPPEGIYESSASFIKHEPELTTANLQMGSVKTIRTWIKRDSLYYNNEKGSKTILPISQVWGFYEDQTLYFQINGFAHKVIELGELSYFTESYPVMKAPYSPVAIEQTKEVSPRIYDFKTNKVINYSVSNFSSILKERDQEIYARFQAIETNKKRRQVLLKYIGIYNERHPLTRTTSL